MVYVYDRAITVTSKELKTIITPKIQRYGITTKAKYKLCVLVFLTDIVVK